MKTGPSAFYARFGTPGKEVSNGLKFPQAWAERLWSGVVNKTASGWFMDGFVSLFGEDNRKHDSLLQYWDFLFTEALERWVIGRNAYGCLLLLESPSIKGTMARVGYLNTLDVSYFTNDHLDLFGLIGNWLPQDRLPGFLDDSVYRSAEVPLEAEEIYGIIKPLSLGGTFTPENFKVENIEAYFSGTGSIYTEHLPGNDR